MTEQVSLESTLTARGTITGQLYTKETLSGSISSQGQMAGTVSIKSALVPNGRLIGRLYAKETLSGSISSQGQMAGSVSSQGHMVGQISGAKLGEEECNTYILIDEDGNEYPAVFVEKEVVFTATANDIRSGTVAATDAGVTVGTKEIPAYHTTEGVQLIPIGAECNISISIANRYDYTKLQAIVCPFNSTIDRSVAAEKVSINDGVYAVGSTEQLATVSVDHSNKTIRLGITNDGSAPWLIRYFTYKEEY